MNLKREEIILRPLLTERAVDQRALGKYAFAVHPKANKVQIRKSVETLFKVGVAKVNVIHVRGKMRRWGRTSGRRPDWKKAVVTLKPGQRIILKGIETFEE